LTTSIDFRQKAAAAILAKFNDSKVEGLTEEFYARLAADAAEAVEPLVTGVKAEPSEKSKLSETLTDLRDVTVGGIRDGAQAVSDNLKSDGPLFTGVASSVDQASDFLSRTAAKYRERDAAK
jgi:hypothetical protein